MTIRQMTEEDIESVLDIENACFTDPWSRKSFKDSLDERAAYLLVMENDEDEMVGYCCLYHALDEGEIVNVAIAPKHRQKGYGGRMVRALRELGESLGIRCFFLEVRAGNHVGQQLYRSLGFDVCGIRKDFYSAPKEDAVLMKWEKPTVCQ